MMIEFNHHDWAVHLIIEGALVAEPTDPGKMGVFQMTLDVTDPCLAWTLRERADMNID